MKINKILILGIVLVLAGLITLQAEIGSVLTNRGGASALAFGFGMFLLGGYPLSIKQEVIDKCSEKE